jgi:hypothetical protein
MSEHVKDLLGEFLVGALDAEASERVASHLVECAECGRELALLEGLERELRAAGAARRRRWPLLAAALAAAACLALLLLRSAPPTEPARSPGLLALADGSRVTAERQARLSVLGPREVRLDAGRARFDVVHGDAPFLVRTPRGTAWVLGTSFLVEIGDGVMNAKLPTAAAVVTVTVVSGVILWKSTDGFADTRAHEGEQVVARLGSVELRSAPPPGHETVSLERLSVLERENAELRAQLAAVASRSSEFETRAATPSGPAPKEEPKPASVLAPRAAPAGPRIAFGPQARLDKLAQIDWRAAGLAAKTLAPICVELERKVLNGEELPPELVEQVNVENVKLIKVALAAAQNLPTYGGGNGAYTHPLVLANVMSGHLEAAGCPFDDGQVQAINAIGAEYDARWEALQAGYGDATFQLEKFSDELELKKDYVGRIDALLTADQSAAIFIPGTKDVMSLDLYSPVLMCAQFAHRVVKPTTDALAKTIAHSWVDDWELDQKNVDALAQSFVAGLGLAAPEKTLPFTLDQALAAARGTLKAMKDAVSTLALDAETTAVIRKGGNFYVPQLPPSSGK